MKLMSETIQSLSEIYEERYIDPASIKGFSPFFNYRKGIVYENGIHNNFMKS